MSEKTIFEACCDSLDMGAVDFRDGYMTDENKARCVIAVIQKIIDLTPSPRTVDELTRILREVHDVQS